MTHPHLTQGARYAKGFSLIELMVSLTIGLVIVVAAMSAYLGASGASKMAEAQGRMNEDAQAALSILSQQLRMAGNNPIQAGRAGGYLRNPVYSPYTATYTTTPGTVTLAGFSIRGCDGRFNNINTASTTLDTLDTSACAGMTSTLADSIAINYEADQYNTIRTSGGLPTDCLGNTLGAIDATFTSGTATTATYAVADNRFYIGTSTAIVSPSLYCQGNGGASTAQPLVENIEDMQFMYGTISTATTSTTATVAGYLTANEVVTEANLAALPSDAARWDKVRTVRICIVVRSESAVVSDASSAKYLNCATPPVLTDAPDLRLRRAYSTTVVLRNRLP